MKIFNLPDLGEGLPDAEIREWHIKEGDEVKTDQPMVSMETAKAVVEVPAPYSGKIQKLYGKPGDLIPTGSPLVEFVDENANGPDKGTVVGQMPVGDTVLTENAMGITPKTKETTIRVIPAVRALAKQLNIDLAAIMGTGPNGQITAADIQKAAAPSHGASLKIADAKPLKGVRKAMAQVMSQAHREVALTTIVDDADISLWALNQDFTVRIIRALVAACEAEPALNAWYDGQALALKLCASVNIGIAIDTKEGLMVPVLKEANHKTSDIWRDEINMLKQQAMDRTIPQERFHEATISLSNFGVYAGRYATPIVVPPMVAIIAIGKSRAQSLPLSLSFDHRAVTGGEASRFLSVMMTDLSAHV